MKTLLLASAMFAFVATSALASTGQFPAGAYSISLTSAGRSSSEPVTVSGSGTTRSIVIASSTGPQTIPATVSATGAVHGTTSVKGMTLTLTGQSSATGASGTYTLVKAGHTVNGQFALAPRSAVTANMRSRDGDEGSDMYDRIVAWLLSFFQSA